MPTAPLVSGSRIVNARTGSPGTLGCIGVGPGDTRFLVSCYHVLGRIRGAPELPGDGEAIWHSAELASFLIALTNVQMMDARLDIAAAPLLPGVAVSPDIGTLGPIRGVAAPVEGARVLKVGAETGLTEGVIRFATDTLVEIEGDPAADDDHLLTHRGDSGALWVSPAGEAVALHFQGRDGNRAFARPIELVLATLGLGLLTSDQ